MRYLNYWFKFFSWGKVQLKSVKSLSLVMQWHQQGLVMELSVTVSRVDTKRYSPSNVGIFYVQSIPSSFAFLFFQALI